MSDTYKVVFYFDTVNDAFRDPRKEVYDGIAAQIQTALRERPEILRIGRIDIAKVHKVRRKIQGRGLL